jgi:hypothetical protein
MPNPLTIVFEQMQSATQPIVPDIRSMLSGINNVINLLSPSNWTGERQ